MAEARSQTRLGRKRSSHVAGKAKSDFRKAARA